MLTPWLRRLSVLLSRVFPPPPPPPRSPRRTRITFCNGAYSTSNHRPILTPDVPEAERPARSLDMQLRTKRVSLNTAIPAIPRDYVWPSSFGTPFSTRSVVFVLVPFSFPLLLPDVEADSSSDKVSRIVRRLSHLGKLANSRWCWAALLWNPLEYYEL